jgi:hypothetical protein
MWPAVLGAGVVFGLLALFGRDEADAAPPPQTTGAPPSSPEPRRVKEGAPLKVKLPGPPRLRVPDQGPPPFGTGAPAGGPPSGAGPQGTGAPPIGAPEGGPPSSDVPFGGVRPAEAPSIALPRPTPAPSPLPPIGKEVLDPEGKLPLYPLGTSFTIALPSVDPEAWTGKAGPPYIAHGKIVELRWSPPGVVAANALESEAASGTYLYVVQLAEFKPPQNTWTGSQKKVEQALASGLFKAAKSVVASVGYDFGTIEMKIRPTVRKVLSDLGLLMFSTDYKSSGDGQWHVALGVPRGDSVVRHIPMNETQMFNLGKLIAQWFRNNHGFELLVDWAKGGDY